VVVSDKSLRVASFHKETLHALAELVAAAGLDHPRQLASEHIMRRTGPDSVQSYADLYQWLQPGELITGTRNRKFAKWWDLAHPDTFGPVDARSGYVLQSAAAQ
jgi:hypothetical protein